MNVSESSPQRPCHFKTKQHKINSSIKGSKYAFIIAKVHSKFIFALNANLQIAFTV